MSMKWFNETQKTWGVPFLSRCEICRKLRQFNSLEVARVDLSAGYRLRPGTAQRNICFCCGSIPCVRGAMDLVAEVIAEQQEIYDARNPSYSEQS